MPINSPNVFNSVGEAFITDANDVKQGVPDKIIAGTNVDVDPASGQGATVTVEVESDRRFNQLKRGLTESVVGGYGYGSQMMENIGWDESVITPVAGNCYALTTQTISSKQYLQLAIASVTTDAESMLLMAPKGAGAGSLMLIRGFIIIGDTSSANAGDPVYMGGTNGLQLTRPTATGDVIRIVGWVHVSDATKGIIYFDPDPESFTVT